MDKDEIKGLVAVAAFICIMAVVLMLTVVEVYKIEMEAYNERMIAFYDKIFITLLRNNMTDLQFNYTPSEPPADLSYVEGIL